MRLDIDSRGQAAKIEMAHTAGSPRVMNATLPRLLENIRLRLDSGLDNEQRRSPWIMDYTLQVPPPDGM